MRVGRQTGAEEIRGRRNEVQLQQGRIYCTCVRTVRMHEVEVKKLQEFKHLGSTVQRNVDCGEELKRTMVGLVERSVWRYL